ncbi:MAG: DNA-formamidopyrimidine glycosylase [Malacoplasma sp.]|nr:DNA-formamidopyrimidine glycosylase [Malacoplasma sp.]
MPELPEVSCVIQNLKDEKICGLKILNVYNTLDKLFKNCSFTQFKDFVIGETINDISRIGKYLIFHLSNNKVFVVHLRMEGKLFLDDSTDLYDLSHTLVRINFGDKELRYHDTRRFGTFTIYYEDTYQESKEIKKLALDPLQNGFDAQYLKKKIKKSTRAIKTVLLTQEIVSGIGNIYADEILYASKIHPETAANQLSTNDLKQIVNNAKLILEEAILNKGTTINSYLYKKDHTGGFQKFLKVHQKKGKNCGVCNSKIIKIKVNGRGTYLCQKCQKIKK